MSRAAINRLTVERFRAFSSPQSLELGRITLLLGRNNAGKSALCFAPCYLGQLFRSDAPVPLESKVDGMDFGPLASVVYRGLPTGLSFELGLDGIDGPQTVGATVTTIPEDRGRQAVTALRIDGEPAATLRSEWPQVRETLAAFPGLASIPDEIGASVGIRPPPIRVHQPSGYEPDGVDPLGHRCAQILWMQGADGLAKINEWFKGLGVRIELADLGEHFALTAVGSSGVPVNLVDSGAGIAQVLPVVVQALLARKMPRLWCVEQPELHLHPGAHALIAQLLLDVVTRHHPEARLLVETHSDVLVLRLRRAIAEGQLAPQDLRLYFIDEGLPGAGSVVREIPLDRHGNPEWWPDGVFAEPLKEFAALRRAIRGQAS